MLGVHIGKESERGGKEMPFFKMLDSRMLGSIYHLILGCMIIIPHFLFVFIDTISGNRCVGNRCGGTF